MKLLCYQCEMVMLEMNPNQNLNIRKHLGYALSNQLECGFLGVMSLCIVMKYDKHAIYVICFKFCLVAVSSK